MNQVGIVRLDRRGEQPRGERDAPGHRAIKHLFAFSKLRSPFSKSEAGRGSS